MSGRLRDWEPRLFSYLSAARDAVEAGDANYCAMFAAGAVEAVTGENPAAAFRGRYREVADNLETVISGLFPEIAVGQAGRGDLAWHDGSVGVIIGGEALFIGEHRDFVRIARAHWYRAWSIE